jgi:hypothetical protein
VRHSRRDENKYEDKYYSKAKEDGGNIDGPVLYDIMYDIHSMFSHFARPCHAAQPSF